MEDISLTSILDFIGIDYAVVLLYICAGLLVRFFLDGEWVIPFTKRTVTIAWKTLLIGSILCGIYVFIEYKYPTEFNRATLKKLFISYVFTTSTYELFLRDIVIDWLVRQFKKIKPNQPNQ